MTIQELKLELVRLTYTHGREASEAVERAKVLQQYVLATEVVPVRATVDSVPLKKGPGKPPKSEKADKPAV